jgi:mannose-1-phosphate guanylyltransferase
MAGGRGERMKASGMPRPKPLVLAAGATLLERNVFRLLAGGINDVIVAVAKDATEIAEYADGRVRDLIVAAGGQYERYTETDPLGNMGCAAAFRNSVDTLLVVYADNITALPLDEMLAHHRAMRADLTLATHAHHYRLPFGQLRIDGGVITDYVEKPVLSSTISSGVSVLGPGALEALTERTGSPPTLPAGMVDLFHAVNTVGGLVAAFRHESAWIDVNDQPALSIAESMIRDHPATFERWLPGEPPIVKASIGQASSGTPPHGAVVIDDVDDGVATRYRVVRDHAGVAAPTSVADRARFHL